MKGFVTSLLTLFLIHCAEETPIYKLQRAGDTGPEYRGAIWVPTTDTESYWERTEPIRRIIVHQDNTATYKGMVGYFKTSTASDRHVNGHYVIDRETGEISQFILEKYAAKHAGDRNEDSIAVFLPQKNALGVLIALHSDKQYEALAGLCRYIFDKYDLTIDQDLIEPYYEGNPGPDFDWNRLMTEVRNAPPFDPDDTAGPIESYPAVGQGSAEIRGLVTNKYGEDISGAEVFLLGHGVRVFSDDQGRFSITELAAGEFTLAIKADRYQTFELTFVLADGEEKRLPIELKPGVDPGTTIDTSVDPSATDQTSDQSSDGPNHDQSDGTGYIELPNLDPEGSEQEATEGNGNTQSDRDDQDTMGVPIRDPNEIAPGNSPSSGCGLIKDGPDNLPFLILCLSIAFIVCRIGNRRLKTCLLGIKGIDGNGSCQDR